MLPFSDEAKKKRLARQVGQKKNRLDVVDLGCYETLAL
jgi:hypothetical protein